MLRIVCPVCGVDAEETEFACGGEAHIRRPDSESATDAEWSDYLNIRTNPMGPHLERWRHAYGCGKWFHLARDTVTQEIFGAYEIRAAGPPDDVVARMRRRSGG